jgi:hypothetical protein
VVPAVGRDHRAQVPEPEQEAHGEPLVHEPVVNHDVRHAEGGHADADTEEPLARGGWRRQAPVEDERDGDGRVEHAQRVVALEAAVARRMMGAMHAPERAVPHPPVEERGPAIHRHRRHQSDGEPDERALEDRDHDGRPGARS